MRPIRVMEYVKKAMKELGYSDREILKVTEKVIHLAIDDMEREQEEARQKLLEVGRKQRGNESSDR
ncbi:hypothetical protein ACFQ49_01055 [Kroppenstedtia eburnea]|uniref:Uncharacterized protein n=2 Tax=Kroppenstedtia TaxID=1274351 RepID=A0A1N7Q2E0_9BACL|nr:hypothetical protein [Kroppenstedtia eburnea]QKI82643.1 hypothetical protein GXN75_11950 [Kroppenstedtia eburnea]SIT16981.1 hypothetical protein SAMN05421790_11716 [Kroppenstedtia eburnea]